MATPMDPAIDSSPPSTIPRGHGPRKTVSESAGLTCASMEWRVLEGTNCGPDDAGMRDKGFSTNEDKCWL